MRTKFFKVLVALTIFITPTIHAQNKVYDIITLKENRGVIMGVITEQIITGDASISILPTEAFIRVDIKAMNGDPLTESVIIGGDSTIVMDCIKLKNGTSLLGVIEVESPNKWYKIRCKDLPEQTYSYNEIASVGKKTINSEDNIFKEYGILEVLYLTNGKTINGVITEQNLGQNLTIKDIKDNRDKVIDFTDIASIKKVPYNENVDMFKQSLFLDVIYKKRGGKARGIIIEQVPGGSVIVEYPHGGGNSDPIPYSDIVKISKESNEYREDPDANIKIAESDSIDVCLYANGRETMHISSYNYTLSKNGYTIIFVDAPYNAVDELKLGENYSFIMRVNGKVEEVIPTLKIWSVDKSNPKSKYISIYQNSNYGGFFTATKEPIHFSVSAYGKSSVKIDIKANVESEYAITYSGCRMTPIFSIK